MKTVKEIKNAILNKIKLEIGGNLLFQEDYDSQISEIEKNFISACENVKCISDWDWIEWFKTLHYHDEFIKKNDLLKKYYRQTNSWVEEWWCNNYQDYELFPIGLYFEFTSEKWERPKIKVENRDFWSLMKNVESCIRLEPLEEVNNFYVNFFNSSIRSQTDCNVEHSIRVHTKIGIVVFLISEKRIIRLVINDKEIVSSKENIIQKDLKKIEILKNINIYFHYHGLHDPDVLVMESYEEAIELRKTISESRESKNLNQRR